MNTTPADNQSNNYEKWIQDNREYLIKQSEMLQNIITRMANNSLTIKQVGLTVWAALVGFGFENQNPALFILAFIAFILFGILDIYYLFQERKFRENFNKLSWIIIGYGGEQEKWEWIEARDGNFLIPFPARGSLNMQGTPNQYASKLYKFPNEILNTLKSWANLPYLITFLITIALLLS